MSHYDDKSLRNNQGFMVHVSPGLVFVAVAKKKCLEYCKYKPSNNMTFGLGTNTSLQGKWVILFGLGVLN